MSTDWWAPSLRWLYADVLKDGLKIRVCNITEKGTYTIRTYEERGWWIFKKEIPRHQYDLTTDGRTIMLRIVFQ